MSDLDIVIRLDPQQPVSGAKAVTAEVAKTEAAGEKAGATFRQFGVTVKGGLDQIGLSTKQLSDGLKSVGKAQMMMALRGGIQEVTSALQEATGVATTFTQMGAAFGPWGAAIGAVVDSTRALSDALFGMSEAERRAAEQTRAFLDMAELQESTLGRVIGTVHGLSDAYERLNKNQALMGQVKFYQGLTQSVAEYKDAIGVLNGQFELNDVFVQRRIELSQGLVTAIVAESMAAKGYGKAAIDAAVAAQNKLQTQVDLAKAYATGTLVMDRATASTRDHAAALREAAEARKLLIAANMHGYDVGDVDAISGGALGKDMSGYRSFGSEDVNFGPSINDSMKQGADAFKDFQKEFSDAIKQAADDAAKLQAAVGSIDQVFRDSLVSQAQTFSSALVDAANGADVAWSDTFKSMLKGIQQAIVQAMILKALTGSVSGATGANGKAIGGLFGLMGFATGGMIMPGGSGGVDSQVVAFRKSPEETVRIHTQAQEAAYRRAASGGGASAPTIVQVIDGRDPRALMQGGRGVHRVVLDAVRENPGAFGALLGR